MNRLPLDTLPTCFDRVLCDCFTNNFSNPELHPLPLLHAIPKTSNSLTESQHWLRYYISSDRITWPQTLYNLNQTPSPSKTPKAPKQTLIHNNNQHLPGPNQPPPSWPFKPPPFDRGPTTKPDPYRTAIDSDTNVPRAWLDFWLPCLFK